MEREHSFAVRRVEDCRSEDHRIEDCRESVRVEEPIVEKKSSLPPPCKKSRKTKVSVCPSGLSQRYRRHLTLQSRLPSLRVLRFCPAFPYPPPGVGSIVLLTIC